MFECNDKLVFEITLVSAKLGNVHDRHLVVKLCPSDIYKGKRTSEGLPRREMNRQKEEMVSIADYFSL